MLWFVLIAAVLYILVKIGGALTTNQRSSGAVAIQHSAGVEWMFHTKVVGVSHRNQDRHSRQKIIREHCCEGQRVRLVPEPNNKFDSNAISVWTDGGLQIGYLNANLARIATEKHEVEDLIAEISAVTGGGYKTSGVNLRIGKAKRAAAPTHALVHAQNISSPDDDEPF